MNPFNYLKELLLLCLLLLTIVLYSCQCHVEAPQPMNYNYMNVPEGDTAIVEDLNITGMGARKNNRNTTWIIKGHVVIDELHVMGHVLIAEKASLTVHRTLHVEEEGQLTVNNQLRYAELNQKGTVYYNTAK